MNHFYKYHIDKHILISNYLCGISISIENRLIIF